jgi:hypothetical protein
LTVGVVNRIDISNMPSRISFTEHCHGNREYSLDSEYPVSDLVKEIEGMDVKAQAKADSDEAAREASDSETVDSSK